MLEIQELSYSNLCSRMMHITHPNPVSAANSHQSLVFASMHTKPRCGHQSGNIPQRALGNAGCPGAKQLVCVDKSDLMGGSNVQSSSDGKDRQSNYYHMKHSLFQLPLRCV